jgi:hypothetical protein
MYELDFVDGSELIGGRAQTCGRDRSSLRAAVDHHSGECEHDARGQGYGQPFH